MGVKGVSVAQGSLGANLALYPSYPDPTEWMVPIKPDKDGLTHIWLSHLLSRYLGGAFALYCATNWNADGLYASECN